MIQAHNQKLPFVLDFFTFTHQQK